MIEFVLVIVLIILLLESRESLTDRPNPYIRLYDNYRSETPVWELSKPGYMNYTFPIYLKKLDINLPKHYDGRDAGRYIEIYAVYPNSPVASDLSKTASVDQYTLAPKYKQIVSIRAGQSAKLEISYPVKSIMVRAVF